MPPKKPKKHDAVEESPSPLPIVDPAPLSLGDPDPKELLVQQLVATGVLREVAEVVVESLRAN